jgi:hypothetical protein
LTSSVFRLILADLFAIIQDFVEHAAAEAAIQMQQVAESVEKKARKDENLTTPELDINETINAVKDQGGQAMDEIENAAQTIKDEWKSMGDDVADKARQKILQRIQQVITRAQKDIPSRAAMRAILVLAKKYVDKIASSADIAASAVGDIAKQASESFAKNTSSAYPPNPYPPLPQSTDFDFNSTLLKDMKEMLERLGKGHSLDELLAALKKVVLDLNEAPVVLVDEINKEIEDKTAGSDHVQSKGKNKKGPSSDKHKSSGEGSPSIRGSPLHAYFVRIGAYLDKGLDDPGWVMSTEGTKILEGLFDHGVELMGIVGESVVEVGAETSRMNKDIQVQFQKDLKTFIKQAEAYVSAVENDKTTMQIFRALDTLGDDLSGLVSQGVKKGRHDFVGLGGWTHWFSWAIPKLMQMLPRSAMPIPSVEIKTKNIEGGLYALFVQGLAGAREDRFGTKLIPDQVVLKEWTEVRIDMAERERPLAGLASKPGVQTTSRFHMHMDGVRAKVEGMGYYFKYFGGLFNYEDEGLLSVDVGMSSLHSGLGVDIEVEMENNNVEFDSVDTEIMIEHEEVLEYSGNRDIQEAVANGVGSALRVERETITNVDSPPEPLFHVVDVKVALAELKFKIDQSRHWILNKLFLQPLAGPVIARVVRQALEDKVRLGLHDLALSLGAVAKEAKRKGEIRRAKGRSRLVQEDPADKIGLAEEELEEGVREILTDWWSAILQKGPMVLGYENGDKVEDARRGKVVETNTKTDATMKGIIHSSTTKTTEQPKGTPVMVYDKASRSMEVVGQASSQPHDTEEETVVAIGGGPQLFPDKGGNNQQSLLEDVRDIAKKTANEVAGGLNEVGEGIERVEDRWGKRKTAEKRLATWKSDAFDSIT